MLGSLISSAFSYFGLDEVPHCGADDCFVAGGDVVLGYLPVVDDLLLCQKVSNIGFLQECGSPPRSWRACGYAASGTGVAVVCS